MLLRNVTLADEAAYVRMRCDPVMMAELGGPLPADGIPAKVRRDVADAEADRNWILMIVPEDERPELVAGIVTLWPQKEHGDPFSEIGWMVLPEYQGRGLAKAATAELLARAGADGRWGTVHAFPNVTNAASNGVCRSLGFTLAGEVEVDFAGSTFTTNHWLIEPPYGPAPQ
jgi:RimJ/RimL family protein N-acetyltransferase